MSDLDDLDAMFPDLGDGGAETPDLETLGTFSGGHTFRQEPPPSTDIALVAMFQREHCTHCQSVNLSSLGFAVKRKHHSRNEVIEYQFVLDTATPLYVCLPKLVKFYEKDVPFCVCCSYSRGFKDEE